MSRSASSLLGDRFEAVEQGLKALLAKKSNDGHKEIVPDFAKKLSNIKATGPTRSSFTSYIRLVRDSNIRHSSWILSSLIRLPFQRLLALAISIRWEYMFPARISLGFDIRRIVSSCSPFMVACANGDHEYASRLLRSNQVTCSPMDIDETGEPAIYVCSPSSMKHYASIASYQVGIESC